MIEVIIQQSEPYWDDLDLSLLMHKKGLVKVQNQS